MCLSPAPVVLACLLTMFTGTWTGASAQQVQASNAPAVRADPAEQPRLQIELGSHAAPIRGVAASHDGAFAITVSGDKSARVWSLADQRLRHVFRPAVGPGAVGALYGVAAHPAEDLVAVGGTTAVVAPDEKGKSAHTGRILLFRPSSNEFVQAIDARGDDITKLAYTPDGRLLLAAYRNPGALRAFDRSGQMVFEDRFAQASYGLAVSTSGRIAATSYEGKVSLYQYDGARISVQTTFRPSIAAPRGVAFSPDGEWLAVGYRGVNNQMGAPTVHSARTGEQSFALPRPGSLLAGNIANVAFSADGSMLYATGSAYSREGAHPVLRYDLRKRTLIDERIVATNTVTDFVPVGAGALVYASFDGSWGTIGADMSVAAASPPLVDLRGAGNLLIDEQARTIAVSMRNGSEPQWFDLQKRAVVRGTAPSGMIGPTLRAAHDRRAQWENTYKPIVNGAAIALGFDEVSRAITYIGSSGHAMLGTSRRLIRLDAQGQTQWAVDAPAEIWSLNSRSDGEVVVGALADGTIRWWRTGTGELLVSLLMLPDERWILWTPDGYFDASAGGDRLAGWAVNRSDDGRADFHSLSRFREQFNQPEHIDRVTAGGSRRAAVTSGSFAATRPPRFPPVVSHAGPARHDAVTGEFAIPFLLRADADASVVVRIDGRPAPDAQIALGERRGTLAAGEARLILPAGTLSVQILAHHGNVWSEPLVMSAVMPAQATPITSSAIVVEVLRPEAPEAANATVPAKADPLGPGSTLSAAIVDARPSRPRLFILAVGISNYRVPAYKLGLAAKDASDFAAVLKSQAGRNYADVQTRVLTDAKADRASILAGFDWLRNAPGPDDVGILFLAGHGLNADGGEYHFLPWDGEHESLTRTAVPESAIRQTLGRMRGKALLFVDTCYAGSAVGTMKSARRELAQLANDLASSENGVVVFASSTGRQLSEENDAWGNGAFTKAAIEGMRGKADFQKTGRITYKALDFYISDEVRRLTEGRQTPVTISPIGVPDFAIVRNETI